MSEYAGRLSRFGRRTQVAGRGAGLWLAVAGLGLGGTAASVLPVIACSCWLVPGNGLAGKALVTAAAAVFGPPLAFAALAPVHARVRSVWPARPRAVLAAVAVLDAVLMLVLDLLLPYREGALSLLLYCLPATFVACVVLLRSRAALLVAAAGLVALYASAAPVRTLQQQVAAGQWFAVTGVPTRMLPQVVVLPGLTQEPYAWDGTSLTAMFDYPMGLAGSIWTGAESVTAGYRNPCAPLLEGEGDGSGMTDETCSQDGPGLWLRCTPSSTVCDGYVLHRDGVTITVSEGGGPSTPATPGLRATLRREILAAHPATDAELWSREGTVRMTATGWLLL